MLVFQHKNCFLIYLHIYENYTLVNIFVHKTKNIIGLKRKDLVTPEAIKFLAATEIKKNAKYRNGENILKLEVIDVLFIALAKNCCQREFRILYTFKLKWTII